MTLVDFSILTFLKLIMIPQMAIIVIEYDFHLIIFSVQPQKVKLVFG